ncbi:MAG TPA: 2-oxo acid dehydrogenase subunit E2 [Glutamicibacter sp.]|uniref:Dihydrolipoamide acetyltransferase component of pyruvate dehydrogenase complex n=1 Tax=Glutamicibacter arilaitensis (strain DSM 16368 / CIP 108037 / IAM 15318 / JCM 13566 / NCIMB 14258 / Re117) TaxID=861360 RepID=A0ABP1U1G3_GLUAR|nr:MULTISPECIES: dihydrolipoamide acetyltransferase family protein [Glutamicibacter]CBT75198.1 dihydrolipoamide acetyltransferase component of pyruvate dehydrogenase complex [Glutamicibacter arilaitensis Re117]HCH48116.1 2-oxo acid dehydrogenase subunit E2 [Glutamicibacter sp.]
MTAQTFKLPDLGEGLTESEVLNWKIKVGEHVALNQIIAEVETAKAVVELPSPFAGFVQVLHATEGETVQVGGALVTFDDAPGGAESQSPGEGQKIAERTPTLVGYGAPAATGSRPTRKSRTAPAARPAPASTPVPAASPAPATKMPAAHKAAGSAVARCTPPVRKLARDHGIDISSLSGSGEDGLVLRRDVEQAIESGGAAAPASSASTASALAAQEGDRHVKITAVRRATAKAMVQSAFTAPHATEFLTVDVTDSMDLVERMRAHRLLKDVKLNITTLAALVVTRLLKTYPALNSTWDEKADEIIEFGSVNLGMAVASDRGLLVPVLKNAQAKTLPVLAAELSEIILQGREGTLSPAQLTGGTFSITNVGVFGVDAGTPILPPGQSGILALGQVKRRPWEYQDQVALRHTMTLALSFDHRVVDGKEASEFLAGVGSVLEDPRMTNIFI